MEIGQLARLRAADDERESEAVIGGVGGQLDPAATEGEVWPEATVGKGEVGAFGCGNGRERSSKRAAEGPPAITVPTGKRDVTQQLGFDGVGDCVGVVPLRKVGQGEGVGGDGLLFAALLAGGGQGAIIKQRLHDAVRTGMAPPQITCGPPCMKTP